MFPLLKTEKRSRHESELDPLSKFFVLSNFRKCSRAMKQTIFTVLILVSSVALASACSCPDLTFQERYGFAGTMVKAKAVSVRRFIGPRKIPTYIFKLRLQTVFKGCAPRKFFYATTMLDGGTCSSVLTKGESYLVNMTVEEENEPSSPDDPYKFYGCFSATGWKYISRKERRFYRRESVKPKNQCKA